MVRFHRFLAWAMILCILFQSAPAAAALGQANTYGKGQKPSLPEGSFAWEYEDYLSWKKAGGLDSNDVERLAIMGELEYPCPVVFTSWRAFSEWLSTLPVEQANSISKLAVLVKAPRLPPSFRVVTEEVLGHDRSGNVVLDEAHIGHLSSADMGEIVIVPAAVCPVCLAILIYLALYALDRWVLDPVFDRLELVWSEMLKCSACMTPLYYDEYEEDEPSPLPWTPDWQ